MSNSFFKPFFYFKEFFNIAYLMGIDSNENHRLAETFNRLDVNNNGEISRNRAVVEISNLIAKQGRGRQVSEFPNS